MNLAITIDNAYVQHACVMLQSLRHHHKDPLNVHCIYDQIDDGNLDLLRQFFEGSSLNLVFRKINSSDYPYLPVKPGQHVSVATYFRILLPGILEDLDEVLFLDTDLLVNADLHDLLKTDLHDYPVAAAIDTALDPLPHKKEALDIPAGRSYFNAGVLKINLAHFRANRLTEQILDFIRHNPEKCEFWDQDALNATFKGNFLKLDPKYNVQTDSFLPGARISNAALAEAVRRPSIIHYSGGGNNKPWLYFNRHPLKKHYYDHLKQTPFSAYIPPDKPSLTGLIRITALQTLRTGKQTLKKLLNR